MKIVYNGELDPRQCKAVLGEQIPALAAEDPDVIYLDADLMNCIGTAKWAEEHPERAINCGIAEANMVGVACGLASAGFKPIVHTFGPFASRRVFDQIFLSGVDDAMFRAFLTDVHYARPQFFFDTVADRFTCSADDVIQVISRLLLMNANASTRMDRCRNDPVEIIVIHSDAHRTGAIVHPRNCH